MENGHDFVDYYDLLQVNPDCDARILELAYRHFAKMYHPDHPETADVEMFNVVTSAYRVLRDPSKRAEYDQVHFKDRKRASYDYPPHIEIEEVELDGSTAVTDAEIHERILLALYKRRREHASDPGMIGWVMQEMFECSEEHFEFHTWYLRSKGLIEKTEEGTLAITVAGVDHVIATGRTVVAEKKLIAKPDEATGGLAK